MLELAGIKKGFIDGKRFTILLENVNFVVNEGQSVAIRGKSGCGKSTLLNILAGLLPFEEGDMFFNGTNISKFSTSQMAEYRRNHIAYITQKFHLLDDRNVFENIALPLQYLGVSRGEIKNRVDEVLYNLNMEIHAKKHIASLSGGECQRVAIARAIVKNPSILLADEPTGSLDETTEESILSVFDSLHQIGMTMVIVTHDDNVSSRCQHIYELHQKSLKNVG
ncbi:ABC transporter ATP-binding protein [Paenibacillus popilliae]|uniref:ATPase component n=1 Tax=Paenibacillus popilliae ATCC 14706 TaxID=1212764 RepID=M9L810_PAEPP|nr:ABC transporter ATP-binding protein [Paenibacillus popilliae]GAC41197.1 ATPase component [Paenibacillus popilliae ATCC 14706]